MLNCHFFCSIYLSMCLWHISAHSAYQICFCYLQLYGASTYLQKLAGSDSASHIPDRLSTSFPSQNIGSFYGCHNSMFPISGYSWGTEEYSLDMWTEPLRLTNQWGDKNLVLNFYYKFPMIGMSEDHKKWTQNQFIQKNPPYHLISLTHGPFLTQTALKSF